MPDIEHRVCAGCGKPYDDVGPRCICAGVGSRLPVTEPDSVDQCEHGYELLDGLGNGCLTCHQDEVERLRKRIADMREAFWGWESCALAAETDPEEVQDADDLWRRLVEIMTTDAP